jgi:hypothetical protein
MKDKSPYFRVGLLVPSELLWVYSGEEDEGGGGDAFVALLNPLDAVPV